jgi:hypothetical protein
VALSVDHALFSDKPCAGVESTSILRTRRERRLVSPNVTVLDSDQLLYVRTDFKFRSRSSGFQLPFQHHAKTLGERIKLGYT